jgi:hypothetical protein
MIQDVSLSMDCDAVTALCAIKDCPASTLLISTSESSILIFSLREDAGKAREDINW